MNELYKMLLVLLELYSEDIFESLKRNNHDFSRNAVHGWSLGTSARNYNRMEFMAFYFVLESLLADKRRRESK